MDPERRPLSPIDVEHLFAAVGELAQVSYAPPNIYPMSAPVFAAAPGTQREMPPAGPLGSYADGRPLERTEYEQTFGSRFDDDFAAPLEKLLCAGIVADAGERLELSARGRLVYDLAIKAFYPEPVLRWMDDRQRLADTARNLRAPAP